MAFAAGVPVWATWRHYYLVPRSLPSPALDPGLQSVGLRAERRLPQTSQLEFPLLRETRSDHSIEVCPSPATLIPDSESTLFFLSCIPNGSCGTWLTADTQETLADGMNE